MPAVRLLRMLLVPAAMVAVVALLRYAAISLEQAFHRGLGEGLMMSWVLLFVAGLPLLLLGASAAGALGRRRTRRHIVPSLGVKIP
jgi:hypothetical protein